MLGLLVYATFGDIGRELAPKARAPAPAARP